MKSHKFIKFQAFLILVIFNLSLHPSVFATNDSYIYKDLAKYTKELFEASENSKISAFLGEVENKLTEFGSAIKSLADFWVPTQCESAIKGKIETDKGNFNDNKLTDAELETTISLQGGSFSVVTGASIALASEAINSTFVELLNSGKNADKNISSLSETVACLNAAATYDNAGKQIGVVALVSGNALFKVIEAYWPVVKTKVLGLLGFSEDQVALGVFDESENKSMLGKNETSKGPKIILGSHTPAAKTSTYLKGADVFSLLPMLVFGQAVYASDGGAAEGLTISSFVPGVGGRLLCLIRGSLLRDIGGGYYWGCCRNCRNPGWTAHYWRASLVCAKLVAPN